VIEDLAVDSSSGPHRGRIYDVWQDHQNNPFGDDLILSPRWIVAGMAA
jgi:hypothetical protein